MGEGESLYRLVFPETGQAGQEVGEVTRELDDIQAARMSRYADHPHARLVSIERIEGGEQT